SPAEVTSAQPRVMGSRLDPKAFVTGTCLALYRKDKQMSSGSPAAAAEGRRSRNDRTDPGRAALERAIVQTVAYADVFDYPLTADEVHRYLIGVPASRGSVRTSLGTPRLIPDVLSRTGRYFTLAGRETTVETRG